MKRKRKTIIIEIDDPDAPALEVVGKTHDGARIVRANRALARKAAQQAMSKGHFAGTHKIVAESA